MNKLQEICSVKRDHIAARKKIVSEAELREQITSKPRGFITALQNRLGAAPYALIAEIKKASPSSGLIRKDFDPVSLAHAYEKGGAACLSVLTDVAYFEGDDSHLVAAREAVSLPVLRKDFMLDPYQITESRALGADCVLLIMAVLSEAQAKELLDAAAGLGMDALIEVHNENELEHALKFRPALLGINNRNLKTLETDLAVSETLAKKLPGNILGVCESGLRTTSDLQRMKKAGLSCFLVGESLLRQADITHATKELLGNI